MLFPLVKAWYSTTAVGRRITSNLAWAETDSKTSKIPVSFGVD
jgi:hypothetical protein